jgi:formylglycine-generating enzyme required for sulfatase activity
VRKRLVLLTTALAVMVVAVCGQESPQVPPREFTNSVGMKFIRIDPASFKMGSEFHGPIHEVTLSKGFYMQTTEVTQAQWEAVMGTNPSFFKGRDRPVEMVSWNDIQNFLRKLNAREKDTRYRLPTEAEWEYACRAGDQLADEELYLGIVAWWSENSVGQTHPVGQKEPNAWGLYDMLGNVQEWVQDWLLHSYSAERQVDPQQTRPDVARPSRVVRGGSWDYSPTHPWRCAGAEGLRPGDRDNAVGFRCARTF